MRMLALQAISTLLSLAFGLVSLGIARKVARNGSGQQMVWLLTGSAFFGVYLVKAVQNVFGTFAFFAGRDTPLWNLYLAWAPALNHSRTVAFVCFFVCLAWMPAYEARGAGHAWLWRSLAAVLAGILAGGLIGAGEGALVGSTHLRASSILDSVELVVALGVLFTLLIRDGIDRLLWIALSLYALRLALNAVWLSAMMGIDHPAVWAPAPEQMQFYRIAVGALMLFVVLRRLNLANQGVAVPALFEPLRNRQTGPAA